MLRTIEPLRRQRANMQKICKKQASSVCDKDRGHWLAFTRALSPLVGKASALGLVPAIASGLACAQGSQQVAADGPLEEVLVTAIRRSLNDAIDSKRNSVLSTESVVAQDIGKFPDLNLAEALQRTSGIAITRDNGEGQQISLRGLGPSFTRVLWNGVPISTASDGGTDVGANRREFDFDVFSSELFTRIDVAKSAAAHQVEGGVSGVVNLRSVRPFDFDGFTANVTYKHGFQDLANEKDPNYSVIVSNIFANETFGVLFGFTSSERSVRVDGFETFDWVSQSVSGFAFDTSGGNNSGLSDEQLDALLLPRLPHTEVQFGSRERVSFVAALQYQPNDDVAVNLDILGASLDSDMQRHNFDVEIRSQNDLIPLDAVVGNNNTIRRIRLLNANRRSENRVFEQKTEQLHWALSGRWQMSERFKLESVVSYAKSEYERRMTTFLARALNTEVTLNVSPVSRSIPEIGSNIDITDPDNFVFDLVRVQPLAREEENTAFHIDGTWGDEASNLRFGLVYQRFDRDEDQFVATGNPANFADNVPALSAIASTLPFNNYLRILGVTPGVFTNHLIIDPAAAARFFNLDALDANASIDETGTNDAEEVTLGGYIELNHITDFLNRELRVNAGVRIVSTETGVSAPFSGARLAFSSSYTEALPSFNLAWNMREDVIVRLAAARTMTRPDIPAMTPNTRVSADASVTTGNPELEPFLANQFDIGAEWYFASESILAFSLYTKDITGFLQSSSRSGPFSKSGVPISILDPQIFSNLTPDTIVDFRRPENLSEPTEINGFEILYQQPLSFITEGAGVLFNYSRIDGDTSFVAGNGESVPSNIVGLSEQNYNIVLYYETESFSVRGSWNYRDDFTIAPCCRNGQPYLRVREGSGQFDLSATYTLPFADNVMLTLEGINLNENEEYTFFGDAQRLQRYIGSGRQIFLGVRANF